MATTGFKIPGVRTYFDRVKNATAKAAAELIVEELQREGPAWTGEFRNAWIIKPGTNVRINPTKASSYTEEERLATTSAESRQVIRAPKLKGRSSNGYTIGNQMTYRNIAMDLVPSSELVRPYRKNKTAEKDWYVKFVQGGKLREILELATGKAEKDPTVRGFNTK